MFLTFILMPGVNLKGVTASKVSTRWVGTALYCSLAAVEYIRQELKNPKDKPCLIGTFLLAPCRMLIVLGKGKSSGEKHCQSRVDYTGPRGWLTIWQILIQQPLPTWHPLSCLSKMKCPSENIRCDCNKDWEKCASYRYTYGCGSLSSVCSLADQPLLLCNVSNGSECPWALSHSPGQTAASNSEGRLT